MIEKNVPDGVSTLQHTIVIRRCSVSVSTKQRAWTSTGTHRDARNGRLVHLWVSDNILATRLHISGAGAHGSL